MRAEVVVDASLAVKWVLEEPYSAEANNLLENWEGEGSKLLAPALFLYEVANVLTKRIQRRQLTLEQAKERAAILSGKRAAASTDWRSSYSRARNGRPISTTNSIRRALSRVGGVSRMRILDRR